MSTDLVVWNEARRAIEAARNIDEVKSIRDKAEAARVYAKQIGETLDMQNAIAEIKIRAERRAGELLAEMDLRSNSLANLNRVSNSLPSSSTLKGMGISENQSSAWQRIAALPEPIFEEQIATVKAADKELTSADMLRTAKDYKRLTERQQQKDKALEFVSERDETFDLHHGDLSVLYDLIPDGAADLFFTDPPYHHDKPHLYGELAELASAKLKPGGLCLAYSGQMHLPQAMAEMGSYLTYWWTFAIRHTGGHLTIWNRHLWNDWKPVLVYCNGDPLAASEWVQDLIDGGGRDKQYHDWGQDASEAMYWIEKLTTPGQLICDPFVGGGAIPLACAMTKRRWIGSDIDESSIGQSRMRLSKFYDTQHSG